MGSVQTPVANVVTAIALSITGVTIYLKPWHYSSKYLQVIDHGPYHKIIGAVLVIYGIALLCASLRAKARDREAEE